jgi:hypothetical protein
MFAGTFRNRLTAAFYLLRMLHADPRIILHKKIFVKTIQGYQFQSRGDLEEFLFMFIAEHAVKRLL